MAERKAFLLRVDPALHKALQLWAQDEFRSLNAHVEFLLRERVAKAGRLAKARSQPPEGETDASEWPPDANPTLSPGDGDGDGDGGGP